jgi:hypothetical protein
MEREITDSNGITWTCVQAYSGLSNNAENQEAAQIKGQEDSYWVVCTPSQLPHTNPNGYGVGLNKAC